MTLFKLVNLFLDLIHIILIILEFEILLCSRFFMNILLKIQLKGKKIFELKIKNKNLQFIK